MQNDAKPLQIWVQTICANTEVRLTDVGVEIVTLEPYGSEVVARALTRANGVAILDVAPSTAVARFD